MTSSASKRLDHAMWIIIIIWVIIQIAVVLTVQDIPLIGDGLAYVNNAAYNLRTSTLYPSYYQIWPEHAKGTGNIFVCYSGYINMLAGVMHIFGTYKAIFWINILFNLVTLGSLRIIAARIVSDNFSKACVILFCLYPYQALIVGCALSEIPSIAMTFLSLAMLKKGNCARLILSALLMLTALYIRETAFLYFIAALIYIIYKKYGVKQIMAYVMTTALGILAIVSINYHNTGVPFFSSSTFGINFLEGANDECRGRYTRIEYLEEELKQQFAGKNVFEIEEICNVYAIDWIKRNPDKWVMLSVDKLKYQFAPERFTSLGRVGHHPLFDSDNALIRPLKIWWLWMPVAYQYLLLILMAYGIFYRRKHLLSTDGIILLPFLGCVALAILTVGNTRYIMPVVPVMIYFAVWGLKGIRRIIPGPRR